MAHREPKGGRRGHGPSLGRKRFARPTTQRIGRTDAAYLKTLGSRPAHKLKRLGVAA